MLRQQIRGVLEHPLSFVVPVAQKISIGLNGRFPGSVFGTDVLCLYFAENGGVPASLLAENLLDVVQIGIKPADNFRRFVSAAVRVPVFVETQARLAGFLF